jgi:hypothetical protein
MKKKGGHGLGIFLLGVLVAAAVTAGYKNLRCVLGVSELAEIFDLNNSFPHEK